MTKVGVDPRAIHYASAGAVWKEFPTRIEELARANGVSLACELGAGPNPILSLELARAHDLEYLIVDVSQDQLDKAPPGYTTLLADAAAPGFGEPERFDLVFSKTVAEHVEDGRRFHSNVFRMLKPGGRAAHFFPTLYAPPFVVNRLLPDKLSTFLLHKMQPGREAEGLHGKFDAHYRWCRGPTKRQLRRLTSIGFEVEEYAAFFGFHGYLSKTPRLLKLHNRITDLLLRHPVPALTSYAYVVLRRSA